MKQQKQTAKRRCWQQPKNMETYLNYRRRKIAAREARKAEKGSAQ